MAYTKVNWDEITPISAANLDQMDQGIKDNASLLDNHSTRHEDGGADELSVQGLSGLLADRQNPTNHAGRHEDEGVDEINLSGLTGAPTTQSGAENIWVQSTEPTAKATGDIWIKT